MTEISQPWGGTTTGDATRAPYTDEEWSEMWRSIYRLDNDSGPLYGSGVAPDPGLTVQQKGTPDKSVDVTAGAALVRGRWYNSNATVNVSIASNASGNPRIDTVVVRADYAAQTIRLAVLTGTPAGSPVAPSLTQTDGILWEIPLADVAVANGFTTIVNANITPRTHWANAADGIYLVDILNNSGGLLETGDVVVWDTTADRAVKTSTTLGDIGIAGVWVGRNANGTMGRVLVRGIGYVKTNGAVASRNLSLVQSTTAKQAAVQATTVSVSKLNPIGVSLQTTAGSGLCLTYVNVRPMQLPAIVITPYTVSVSIDTTSASFVDLDATNLKITITPHSSRVKLTALFFAELVLGSAHAGYYDWYSVSLNTRAGDANNGLIAVDTTPLKNSVTMIGFFTGLTPGVANEFRIRARSSVAGQIVSIIAGQTVWMYAEEV